MRKLTISIAAAALASTAVAIAAPQMGGHMMPGHGPMGDVTRAQVEAMAAQHFAKLDVNGDGKLDGADRAAMRARMFDRIDTNHDGMISRDEFAAMHQGRGHGPDGDGPDGDRGPGMGGEPPHMMAGGEGMGGHPMDGRGMHRGGMAGMMMKMADTDHDGSISQAEFTAAALKHFDMADANHDGTLTQAERKAAHEAMRARMQAREADDDAQ